MMWRSPIFWLTWGAVTLLSATPLIILRLLHIITTPVVFWMILFIVPGGWTITYQWMKPNYELLLTARRMKEGTWMARPATRLPEPWGETAAAMEILCAELDRVTREFEEEVRSTPPFCRPPRPRHFFYDVVVVVREEGHHLVVASRAVRGGCDQLPGQVISRTAPEAEALRRGMYQDVNISRHIAPLKNTIAAPTQMTVPIRIRERTIGGLVVQSRQTDAFDEDDVFTVRTIAGQVAVALENARLFASERRLRNWAITEERNRLAREIHNTLAQGFMGILMHLRAMRGLSHPDDYEAHRRQAKALAQESLEETR